MVVELAGQLPAADDPDVLPLRRRRHLAVHGAHVAAHEADVGAVDARQRTGSEDPCRLLVRPRLRRVRAVSEQMRADPFVRR